MKKLIYYLSLIAFILTANSCHNSSKQENKNILSDENFTEEIEAPKYHKLIGQDIAIRVGPGENFDKLINKKATEMLGETHYCHADYSFLVEIVEEEGEWAKIKTIQPEHLSNTYNGWIPTSSIKKDNIPGEIKKLDSKTFEVISENSSARVTNYHILTLLSD